MTNLEEQMKVAEQKWQNGWKEGPKNIRWTEIPLQVGDTAIDFALQNMDGVIVKLSDFWKERPALILFYRHYECSCSVDRSKRLREEYQDYTKSGANVVIIGQGKPLRSKAYAEKYELPPVSILSDLDLKAYRSWGLLEGKPSQIVYDAPEEFLDRDIESGIKLAEARKIDNRPLTDSPWLLPGEFVVDRNGIIQLTYRYNYCEDFPDHRVLLAAIREAKLNLIDQ